MSFPISLRNEKGVPLEKQQNTYCVVCRADTSINSNSSEKQDRVVRKVGKHLQQQDSFFTFHLFP